jgi:uncharacterized protein YdeI (BOF family)
MEVAMKRTTIIATLGTAALLAAAPLGNAAETSTNVTLFGTVERITNDQQFVLRDNSRRVTVIHDNGAILDEGDSVIVTGAIDHNDLTASRVNIHRRATL